MRPPVDDVLASRWLNWRLGGDPAETYCSRLWRWRWLPWCAALILWIDLEAVRREREPWGHCRRARLNDRARRYAEATAELDGRLRMVDEG